MATWHLDVTADEEKQVQEIAEHLSRVTGVRVSRAAAIRWAVARTRRRIDESPEDLS